MNNESFQQIKKLYVIIKKVIDDIDAGNWEKYDYYSVECIEEMRQMVQGLEDHGIHHILSN